MRSSGNARASLVAAMGIAMVGAGNDLIAPPLRSAWRDGYRPTPPRMDTQLQREIAEHNAEVDRRKAEKRAAKMARRVA